ncbi:hypothetical protein [Sedimenticola sp.]|uniref:hypothetical protein n=1 Tax=Sedimenticola sp. TaxID=1940285 RepID=UPI003D10A3A1
MKALVPLVISSLAAVSCVSTPKMTSYNPDSHDEGSLAKVSALGYVKYQAYTVHTSIAGLYDEGQLEIENWNRLSGYIDIVQLQKGDYYLGVACSLGYGGSLITFDTVPISVGPRENYYVYCLPKFEDGLLGSEVPTRLEAFVSRKHNLEEERLNNILKMKLAPPTYD